MPTYMGNVGHLMQHWTLCELLTIAADEDKRIPGLNFIDAHAMAPLARVMGRRRRDDQFDGVRDRLPGQRSTYERAWHHLAPDVGYPSSAVFVEQVWKRDFALLLCETDWPTIAELGEWCDSVRGLDRCSAAELAPGDWRQRFSRGLPGPADVGLPEGSLTLVSFDPDRIELVAGNNGRRLYLGDLRETVLPALQGVKGGILVHLPTYALQQGSTLRDVTAAVDPLMEDSGFALTGNEVRIPGNNRMMSLIYARDVQWADELANLAADFTEWFNGV